MEEKHIADKVDIELKYPKWDKDRRFWKCTCGKRMIPRPFKLWKDEVVNRMYNLRLNQKHDIITLIDDIFSEGFFNYFYTTYGSGNQTLNEKMIEEISKKIEELKRKTEGL